MSTKLPKLTVLTVRARLIAGGVPQSKYDSIRSAGFELFHHRTGTGIKPDPIDYINVFYYGGHTWGEPTEETLARKKRIEETGLARCKDVLQGNGYHVRTVTSILDGVHLRVRL